MAYIRLFEINSLSCKSLIEDTLIRMVISLVMRWRKICFLENITSGNSFLQSLREWAKTARLKIAELNKLRYVDLKKSLCLHDSAFTLCSCYVKVYVIHMFKLLILHTSLYSGFNTETSLIEAVFIKVASVVWSFFIPCKTPRPCEINLYVRF